MNDQVTLPRTMSGVVIGDKMQETIVVLVERRVRHPKYQKIVRRSTKLHVHNPKNVARQGDVVTIKECRPISKTKSWILESINKKADIVEGGAR